nr:RHO protein GDP dissociation inhibitor domain containing protein [Haemonchus contortus]
MNRFGSQQEEIESLNKENLELGKNFQFVQASTDLSSRNDEVYNAAETIASLQESARSIVSVDVSNTRMETLKGVQKELELVKSACTDLGKLYEDEQKKLCKHKSINEQLRRKLSPDEKEVLGEDTGDTQQPAAVPMTPSLQLLEMKSSLGKGIITVESMSFLAEGREPLKVKVNPIGTLQKTKFCVKEGTQYSIRIEFSVQNESIEGLRYIHKVNRMHVNLSKSVHRLGTYRPQMEVHSFTVEQTVPEGVLHRGKYTIKSQLIDGNEQNWLTWSWILKVVKKL